MPTGQMVAYTASTQAGDRYIFGVEVSMSDPNPRAFDCCLSGDTIVHTERGPVPIVEVEPGDRVWSWNDGTAELRKVEAVAAQPVQLLYTLRTRNRSIRATANHPFLVLRRDERERIGVPVEWRTEWVRLDGLEPGDHVVAFDHAPGVERPEPVVSGGQITADLAWLFGFYMGDGSTSGTSIQIAAFGHQREALTAIAESVFGATVHHYDSMGLHFSSRLATEMLAELGFSGATSATKRVPALVKQWPVAMLRRFLDGYADADGHFDKRGHQSYSSCSRTLIAEVRALHINLGDAVSNITVNRRTSPIVIKGVEVIKALPLWSFTVYPDSPRRDQTLLDTYGARRALPDRAFTARKVLGITPDEVEETFDLQVEGAHNYVADGLLVHNSELVEWTCSRLGVSPRVPDGSANQLAHCRAHKTLVSIQHAIDTPGALLFVQNSKHRHVAISRGNGQAIEARNSRDGTGIFSSRNRGWTHAGLIPGVLYGSPEPPHAPALVTKPMMAFTVLPHVRVMPDLNPGAVNLHVIWLQRALHIASGVGLKDDGQYGDRTVLAVAAFQRWFSVGPDKEPTGYAHNFTRFYLAAALEAIRDGRA